MIHYNIIILDTAYNMYIDMVYMLTYYCKLNNISHSIIEYDNNLINTEDVRCIFFGTEYYKYRIPKGSIITEFDCIDVVKNRVNLSTSKNKIISYSSLINNYIKQVYPKTQTGMFKFGYTPELDYGYPYKDKPIDICFIGSLNNERRKIIFDELKNKFKNYNIFLGGYQPFLALKERGEIYKKSKIVISIYSEKKLFDYTYGSRIFPAVSTGSFVIAEKCTDEEQHSVLEQICINTEPENLLDTIDYYLHNETEREDKRLEFYSNIKSITPKMDLN